MQVSDDPGSHCRLPRLPIHSTGEVGESPRQQCRAIDKNRDGDVTERANLSGPDISRQELFPHNPKIQA
eukprot:505068-Amphidinium_carterae.1